MDNLNNLEMMSKEELLDFAKRIISGGITLSFNGKRTAQVIERKVMPRIVKIDKKLSFNSNEGNNIIIDGENLQAMVTLYKYKGQIDLIVTDPPYNTGKDFRYNDKWDIDPNDPDLGELVTLEDGSRHTKWMRFMLPRIQMMKAMLKPNGALAICIDEREFFHLGMLLNEVFGEENRIGIINWQKSYSPKNDSKHVSTATEYVLVYAKDKPAAKTNLMPREQIMDSRYWNPDNDPLGVWKKNGDATVATPTEKDRYGIQSPFTGAIHYPGKRAWLNPKKKMKEWLKAWGSDYVEKDLKDGRAKALVISKAVLPTIPQDMDLNDFAVIESEDIFNHSSIVKSRKKAENVLKNMVWPILYFGTNGYGRPSLKRHLNFVKRGKVPMTYWADEDYDEPMVLEAQSWDHEESGHSQAGINELDAILGKGHNFETVKPLKLIKKIIHLWCPPDGIVLDPFAGSGTTGHAVLELNDMTNTKRSFILIEKGEEEDKYARTLTRERVKRAIAGERVTKDGTVQKLEYELGGGFAYWVLDKKVDAKAILEMKRDELIDVITTSHWEDDKRKTTSVIKKINKDYKYLVGKNILSEGFFIIWNGKDSVGELNQSTYMELLAEAKKEGVNTPFHVYARYQVYQTPKVRFYQIPDKVLMHLGLNENSDRYNNEEE